MAKPIPDGYHAITPYLIVAGGAKALEFYARAFGAIERERMQDPSGKIRHAEIRIGDSCVMLADEHPEIDALGPATIGGSPVASIKTSLAKVRIRNARKRSVRTKYRN